jgi:hypothetical protein
VFGIWHNSLVNLPQQCTRPVVSRYCQSTSCKPTPGLATLFQSR